MKKYRSRIVDKLLSRYLRGIGAVLIEGPKWCGKTTTAAQQAETIVYMNNPDSMSANLELADMNPRKLLEGATPVLLDEWQLAPKLWDTIRFECDQRGLPGQFILTGSAVPPESKFINHSGTGRFARLTMRPMSLYESGDSIGSISLRELFEGNEELNGVNKLTLDDIAWLICRGGWPMACVLDKDIALDQAKFYVDAVVNSDISRVDNTTRNPALAMQILRSYARNQGTQATYATLTDDVAANFPGTDTRTITAYAQSLRKIFVIEDSLSWNPNLRSKSAIRTTDTRYFVDPSIAVAAMGLGPKDLLNDLKATGMLFETLCVRDLRVYVEALDGKIYHFRDRHGLECDAVAHLRNGKYGLIEIKLGGDRQIDEGAANLLKLRSKIDTERMNHPSFMMVLTAVGTRPYKRADGVMVIPVGCLKD